MEFIQPGFTEFLPCTGISSKSSKQKKRTERGVQAEKRGHPTFLDLQTVRKGEEAGDAVGLWEPKARKKLW